MEQLLTLTLYAALMIHIAMITIATWRVWRGENVADRLIGLDTASTLILAVLVLVSLITRDSIYIDVALGLGALGFVSTIALSKYISDEQMF